MIYKANMGELTAITRWAPASALASVLSQLCSKGGISKVGITWDREKEWKRSLSLYRGPPDTLTQPGALGQRHPLQPSSHRCAQASTEAQWEHDISYCLSCH